MSGACVCACVWCVCVCVAMARSVHYVFHRFAYMCEVFRVMSGNCFVHCGRRWSGSCFLQRVGEHNVAFIPAFVCILVVHVRLFMQ